MHTTNPDPLDPSKVKAGDTVTLESGTALVRDVVIEVKSRGVGQFVFYTAENPDPLIPGTYYLVNQGAWTLTDHQPAPEPEPEYEPRKVYEHPNGDRLWSVNSERGVQFVNEYGEKFPPGNLTFPVRPLVVIDPAAVDVEALTAAAWDAQDQAILEVGLPEAEAVTRAVLARLGIEAS